MEAGDRGDTVMVSHTRDNALYSIPNDATSVPFVKRGRPPGDAFCSSTRNRKDDQKRGQAQDLAYESAEGVQKYQQEQANDFGGLTGSSRIALGGNLRLGQGPMKNRRV